MTSLETLNTKTLARVTGAALLGSIIIGIAASILIAHGIDVNLTADVKATAENMLGAEVRLRAKAYVAGLGFGMQILILIGFFILLQRYGFVLAVWSFIMGLGAASLALMGAVYAMNAAEIASHSAFAQITDDSPRLMLAALQATSDYTSFHLSLILSTISNVGFFYLFLRSGLIPKIIAGWGLFASLFVVTAMLVRDFIPAIGHNGVTIAFMLCNLIALISTGLYLVLRGVRLPDNDRVMS